MIYFQDENGEIVENLLTTSGSWQVEAVLEYTGNSDKRAKLIGGSIILVTGGWANFTDLGISHAGTYNLKLKIKAPSEFGKYVYFTGLHVTDRVMEIDLVAPGLVGKGQTFIMKGQVIDTYTRAAVTDLTWRDRDWSFRVVLAEGSSYNGELQTSEVLSANLSSGELRSGDITIDNPGRYRVVFIGVS